MKEYTQKELIMKFVKEYGSIIPAKLGGYFYKNQLFGSETPKRCRELRKDRKLESVNDGKFTKFFLPNKQGELW